MVGHGTSNSVSAAANRSRKTMTTFLGGSMRFLVQTTPGPSGPNEEHGHGRRDEKQRAQLEMRELEARWKVDADLIEERDAKNVDERNHQRAGDRAGELLRPRARKSNDRRQKKNLGLHGVAILDDTERRAPDDVLSLHAQPRLEEGERRS